MSSFHKAFKMQLENMAGKMPCQKLISYPQNQNLN